ncbi:hypothetical protein KC669_02445 [Candidatus Dojkabacteria bacterium]|uniref:Dystroglycan-type cadherin-like domain-containing protein n=1 Tax=Candidatus Dojkabacteria bacterium TaxID=2099670 RepID=A0A955LA49_9BACT|nr:hypothetical protein [Candidatus Dojkabacteria bacterium]
MKYKIKLITLLSLPITLALVGFFRVNANALVDPNDIFTIVSPTPNSKVKGNTNISVRVYDDEQSFVYLQINLYDRTTCNDTNYGSIGNISSVSSNPGQNSVIPWTTTSTNSNTNIPDGVYCLKICASLVNGNNGYSVCNGREVQIVNNNSLPSITSQPQKTNYIEGESFSYQMSASDPDNDTLTYRLVAAPEILTINSTTGLISSGPLSTLGHSGLEYSVTVAVSDGISGETTQNFKFTVKKPALVVNPPNNGGTVTPPDNQTPDDQTPDDNIPDDPSLTDDEIKNGLSFEQPVKGTVFTDEQNLIKWKLPDIELESLSLEYSADGEEWLLISDAIETTRTYYLWDISELTDNKYYLRIIIETKDGRKFIKQSEQFETNINTDNDGDTTESVPLIINVQPENESETTNKTLTLSGDLLPSEDAEIDIQSFNITLDENDILATCEVNAENFSCAIDTELELGKHLVKASVSDSSEQTAETEWTFNVIEENIPDDSSSNSDGSTVVIFGREIPRSGVILLGIILCIGGALLLIPWILYSIWSGRDEDKKVAPDADNTTIENNYDFNSTDYSYPSTNDLPSIDAYSSDSASTSTTDYSTQSSIPSYDPSSTYDINSTGSDYSYTPSNGSIGAAPTNESSTMPEMPSIDTSATKNSVITPNPVVSNTTEKDSANYIEPEKTS